MKMPEDGGQVMVRRSVHHPTFAPEVDSIDQEHLQTIHKFLTDMNFGGEENVDLTEIHLRPVFQNAKPLGITVLFYAALVIVGIIVNSVITGVICKRKLYKTDNVHLCVLNLTLAFLIQLFLVVPLSLFVLVVHNWILGSFICYTLPILQDFPTYCITLTLLVLCVDRHQSIRHPELGPLPMRWILCLVWAISLALVLPYMAYITHVDLSILGSPLLDGAEMCIISLSGTASQYIKVLFVLCYVVPVVLITILLSRTSYHIRRRAKAQSALHREENEETADLIDGQQQPLRTSSSYLAKSREDTTASGISTLTMSDQPMMLLDIAKEKRSQRFLILVATVYFACLLPLNVLKIVRQVVTETYDNDDHFDITYIIIVWFAFLPTVIVPWFIAHWLLIGALRKDRFLPYFNNGNNGHHRRSSLGNGNRHQHFDPTAPSSAATIRPPVNETIMVHDLGQMQRGMMTKPNDHPTPGKNPKRPRNKPTNGHEQDLEVVPTSLSTGISNEVRRSGSFNPNDGETRLKVGRRRSHCLQIERGGGHFRVYPPTSSQEQLEHQCCNSASPAAAGLLEITTHYNTQRRHSSYNTSAAEHADIPPPPPPHQGTVV